MNRRETLKLIGASAALAATGRLVVPGAAFAQAPAAEGPFKLPPLGYPYEALEPHIDAQTMMIHHDKHHAAYVNMCNEFAKQVPALATTPIEKTLADPAYIPVQLQQSVKNNLGGHWNHTFFWDLMKPGGAKEPSSELKSAIEGSWKDVGEFKEKLNAAGGARFGSGWAWLVVNKDKKMELISTANQDTPIAQGANGDHRRRCVGARLLSEVPEPSARLSQGLVEYGELGQGVGELQEGDGLTTAAKETARCLAAAGRPMMRAVQPCRGHLWAARP